MTLGEAVEAARGLPPALTYGLLFGGALVEYVVPPFPGDTVVLAGAVLVAAFGWSPWPVFAVVTAGALVGAALDFAVGVLLVRRRGLDRLGPRSRRAVDDLVGRFRRHGPVYLVLNRFLPGVRALFFVAAGLAGLRLRDVLLWAGLSAMAWNALLVAAGYAVGANVEALERLASRYQAAMWAVIAAVVVVVGYKVWRAAAALAEDDPDR